MTTRTRQASLGRAFVESEQYQRARRAGYFQSGHPFPEDLRRFDLLSEPELRSALRLRTYADLTDFDIDGAPYIGELLRAANLPSAVETIPVDKLQVEVASEVSESENATAVEDGDPLPEGSLNAGSAPTLQELPRFGVAQPVTLEVLDEPGLVESFIDRRLQTGLQFGLENDILNGNGSPGWTIGAIAQAGADNAVVRSGGTYRAVALRTAVGNVQVAGWYERPLQIVIHPTTYASLYVEEDGSQRPLPVAEMFSGVVDNWIVSNKIPIGSALVGDLFNSIALFVKGGLTVEMSRNHRDFLARSMVALMIEFRTFAWVRQPEALALVTGLT